MKSCRLFFRNRVLSHTVCCCMLLFALLAQSAAAPAETFYWDNPKAVTREGAWFPAVVSDGNKAWCFFEETVPTATGGSLWISLQTYTGRKWSASRRIAGPFSYVGEVPDCFSVARSGDVISCVVAGSENELLVYTSSDGGEHFSEHQLSLSGQTAVGPRVFAAHDGSFLLFASLGTRDLVGGSGDDAVERFSFSLIYARSADGEHWEPFAPFSPASSCTNPFSPYMCSAPFGDIVVFQAQYADAKQNRFTNQLYVTLSTDGLQTWSPSELLTDAAAFPNVSSRAFSLSHNQRPYVYASGGHVYVAWERSLTASESATVWIGELGANGHFTASAEQVSVSGSAHRPVLFSWQEQLYALWFDNRRGGDSLALMRKNGYLWEDVSIVAGTSSQIQRFASPFFADGELSFIWQEQGTVRARPRLYVLQKDHAAKPPRIVPVSFTEGKRSTAEKVRARVVFPEDPSGISGFSWLWTQNSDEEPPETLMNFSDSTSLSAIAPHDGTWFFKVRVRDYAGNWSPSAVLAYRRDITPPQPPVIAVPALDAHGFVSSNSFSVRWKKDASDDDVAGYSWSLHYVSPLDKTLWENSRHPLSLSKAAVKKLLSPLRASADTISRLAPKPPRRLLGKTSAASYDNVANGLYAFSVCAIDTVGNISKSAVIPLLLNKYEPVTAIVDILSAPDSFGSLDIAISGRGFSYDGSVSELYIDRDGVPPYDITLSADAQDFTVISDELIRNIHLENADAGVYKVGLFHTDRGLYFSDKTLKIDEYGTVKLSHPYQFTPSWRPASPPASNAVPVGSLLLAGICIFSLFALAGAIKGFAEAARETVVIRRDIRLLMRGTMNMQEKTHRIHAVRRRRSSLKLKFSIFTVQGVLVVAALVSIPLGYIMLRVQSRTLASGLEQRVTVLMNSIDSSVRMYMPSQNDLELGSLPNLNASMAEAESITILGLPRALDNTNLNYVWATNDDEILSKIDSAEYVQGASRLTDPTVLALLERFAALNDEAVQSVSEMTQHISELTAEGTALAVRDDFESNVRRNQINDEVRLLSTRSTELLRELSDDAFGSVPAFDVRHLDDKNQHYLFYKPVLYRQGSEALYVRSVILVQVSTEALLHQVESSSKTLVFVSLLITAIVTTIGIFSSLVFVSVLVRPIRLLVDHVEMISHTRRKETLAGRKIDVRSNDEIGILGDTVNEMTRSLVKAALEENLLMDGKSVQQAFIPLISDDSGNKKTTAAFDDGSMQLFGYYEGASGVSGDYFDYKKLDERWCCIIKCDASGHGVPAALIMTVVATMFRQYFNSWSWRINGTGLDTLVKQINDFIESLGLRGKFTTLMICLFDTATGDVHVCNAGDNLIHYYDSSEQTVKAVQLSQTPAAGSLPSFMVDMKGGFSVEKIHLDKDDVLFLYTDGIEESTRRFRDSSFSVVQCSSGAMGHRHGNHLVGENSEQLSSERIKDIIEAVFARTTYRLEKYHNPIPNEELLFDFSECKATVEDAVLALAAVEKVFRLVKMPASTGEDVVRVDRNIDSFLKQHFNQYAVYCAQQNDSGESNYLYYTTVREDEQLDDLTLLAVKKCR